MTNVQHHQHVRKRIHQNLEKYPHPDKFKRFFDKLIYVAGIAMPILTIPQLTTIWFERNAAGVSLLTWSSYIIIALIFSIYGLIHKEKPLIIMHGSMLVLEVFIVIGILLYG